MAVIKNRRAARRYASARNGTPQHLAGEIYSKASGTHLSHIPYRGAGAALNDLLGGQVKVMFDIVASSSSTSTPANWCRWR